MSRFFGRRFITSGTSGDGYSDHGLLSGLEDDDHLQYLITSAIRIEDAPTSGISKTTATSGDVFSLINAGTGAALFVKQTGTTADADAAVDIVNTGNVGRGLSVFSETADPSLPLVQFSALSDTFDEPVLLITHADPRGPALDVRGDGYLSGMLEGPMAVTFTGLDENPIELGDVGIYVESDTFYFVDSEGEKHTFSLDEKVKVSINDTTTGFLYDKLIAGSNISISEINDGGNESVLISGTGTGTSNVEAGCNVNVNITEDGYKSISLDLQSIAGGGLVVDPSPDGCNKLVVELDAYQVGYDSSGNVNIFATNVQDAISEIDGYLTRSRVRHIRKLGSEADDFPFNSVFSLDGYEYPIDEDRILVYINGIAQFDPTDYRERSTTSIETSEPRDHNDIIDILILPGSFGAGMSTSNLQNAYDNSPSNAKSIIANDGQVSITQPLATGAALRLISDDSVTPTLIAEQSGSGETVRFKSIDGTKPTLLIQKDTVGRNSMVNTTIIERTTSHILGGQTGIGSSFLTRLESAGTNLFDASKIITGTESVSDAVEKTYLSIELSDDGVLTEHFRINSEGKVGIKTVSPNAILHVEGDGYFSQGVEITEKLVVHNSPNAPFHIPVLISEPPTLEDGDMWISDSGGNKKINARIGGVTYSVILT